MVYNNSCPTCGRRLPQPKITVPTVTDTRTMSDTALFAYYKRTAPLEDVRFTLSYATLSANLRARFEALEARITSGLSRADAYRAYEALQADWRAEANQRARQADEPAIGTPAWFAAFEQAEDDQFYRDLGQVYIGQGPQAVAA